MQKKNLSILRNIAIVALLTIIITALGLIIIKKGNLPQTMNEQAKAEYTTQIGNQTYDITNAVTEIPNLPNMSAGMIPVKLDGESWVITSKDDTDWYNYKEGKPAYIMLSDGTYQSEIQANMINKKLASENVGVGIPHDPQDTMGTIYMWIPRFAYNSQGEILYIKQCCSVAGTWTIPKIFINENEKMDLSYSRNMGRIQHISKYKCSNNKNNKYE